MAKKEKGTKKAAPKKPKRVSKKELETSLTDRFMEVVSGLGHDAGKIGKDIKKVTKQLAKKLSEKFQDVKQDVGKKLEAKKKVKVKSAKRPLTTPKVPSKAVTKAEKVVAKVVKANEEKPAKRAYVRRAVKPVVEDTRTPAARKPRVARKTSTAVAKPKPTTRRTRSTPVKIATSEAVTNNEVAPENESENSNNPN